MAGATFGSGWSASDDKGAVLAISDDGLALTVTFADMQADADPSKAADLLVTRVFSAVLPIDGAGDDVEIAFATSGFASVSEGADAYALLSVNGQSAIQQFPVGTDGDFVQQLTVTCAPGSPCHLVVAVVARRDPAYPDAAAALGPLSLDAQFPPSR